MPAGARLPAAARYPAYPHRLVGLVYAHVELVEKAATPQEKREVGRGIARQRCAGGKRANSANACPVAVVHHIRADPRAVRSGFS